MSDYYAASGSPASHAFGFSAQVRAEFANIATAFAKLPAITAAPSYFVRVNGSATALESINPSTVAAAIGALTAAAAASTYLTIASAASTYQPLSGMSSYLTTASAASTYAPIASPTLTGTPAAPTATAGTNTTQLATTAFVAAAVTAGGGAFLPLAGGTMTGLIQTTGIAEVLRAKGASPYISGFDATGATRTGYLQFNAGASVLLNAESGSANIALATAGVTRFNIGTASVASTLPVTAPSFSATNDAYGINAQSATTAGNPGLRIQNSSGARRLEVILLDSTSGSAYGAAAGDTVYNVAAGNAIFSTADTQRIKIATGGQITITSNVLGNAGVELTASTSVNVAGGNGSLQLGFTASAITSTADAFAVWAGAAQALNTFGGNGTLLLAARNSASCGIVLATSNTAQVFVDTSGNVGIGTKPSLGLSFEIHKAATTIAIDSTTAANSVGAQFYRNGTLNAYLGGTGTAGQITSGSLVGDFVVRVNSGRFVLSTDNGTTNAMIVDASGNLGIGVSPSYKLDVGGAGALIGLHRASDGAASGTLGSLSGTDYSLKNTGGGTAEVRVSAGTILLQTGGAGGLALDGSGNVGLGTSALSTVQLAMSSSTTNPTTNVIYLGSYNNSAGQLRLIWNNPGSNIVGIGQDSGGSVIIGTTGSSNGSSPTARLTITQSGGATFAGALAITGALTGATTGDFSGIVTMAASSTVASKKIGFQGLPAASVTTGAFVAADAGKCVYATAGVTIPNSTMAAEDTVVIQNTTAGAITITVSATNGWNCNTGVNKGGSTVSLSAKGRMSVVFDSATNCYLAGNIT